MATKLALRLIRRTGSSSIRTISTSSCKYRHSSYPDTYQDEWRRSVSDPEGYWSDIAKENTVWTKPWTKVLDDSNPPFARWFVGGELSVCYNAVDRHVDAGKGDKTAVIWDSPVTGDKSFITYSALQDKVSRLAGLMAKLGVSKGDRVMVYMPMIPETLVAMLATARLGATHSVVFGGFSASELARRIRHLQPKLVLAASCGVEPNRVVPYKPNVDEGLKLANAPSNIPVVVFQRSHILNADLEGSNDIHWQDEVESCQPHDCVPVEANHPLYVLYTSGTTGDPKGIAHSSGAHAVVKKWTMRAVYGMEPDDVWWAGSDFGWVVGHSYCCYAPLLNGMTTVLYEGKPVGTPDSGQYFRVISEHGVNGFFTTPTAMRAVMAADPDASKGSQYDLKSLRYCFIAGEHCDPATMEWTKNHLKVPVLDHWWQTETSHAITGTCVGLGNSLDPPIHSSGKPVPGFDVRIMREDGTEADKPGELGRIVCKLPMAPGTMMTLYNAPDRFKEAYFDKFPGYYDTMDAGVRDPSSGDIMVMSREDDVINVAGHRLSTSAIEEVVLNHPDVVDAAVVGVPDAVKGQLPLILYIASQAMDKGEEEMTKQLAAMVRDKIGAVASTGLRAVQVPGLPKTRSGKIARKSMSDMASGKAYKVSPTIEDPTIYPKIETALKRRGFVLNTRH